MLHWILWLACSGPQEAPADPGLWMVVAARDLSPGVPITADDIRMQRAIAEQLHEGVFVTPVSVIDQIPTERILAGEPVRAERLSDPDRPMATNATLPHEMRALTITVDDQPSLDLVHRQSFVDARTPRLLEHLLVTDVRRSADHPGRLFLTLLVPPEQAEQLATAEGSGQLEISPTSTP